MSLKDLSPDVLQLIAVMKTGEVTQVLRGNRGYQLLKVESMTTAATQPFEEAREDISNRVFTDKRKQEFDKYQQRLRSEAII